MTDTRRDRVPARGRIPRIGACFLAAGIAAAGRLHGAPKDRSEPGPAKAPTAVSVRLTEPRSPYWVGLTTFTAAADSPPSDPVARVEFSLDGVTIGIASKEPYRASHDFRDTLSEHRLTIIARTASGAMASAAVVSLGAGVQQRAGIELVLVPVSVLGPDRLPVRGLRREDFALYEEGIPQTIATFDSEPTPVSLAFGVDQSGSMRPYVPFVRAAAVEFIRKLPPFFSVSLILFADRADRASEFTFNRAHVYYELDRLRAGGGTALFQASHEIVASLRRRPGRRVAAIFTDGQDSVVPDEEADAVADRILSEARTAGVMVFYVGYGWIDETHRLEAIAKGTGGEYLPGGGRRLKEAFDRIAANLNSQYTLGFEPNRPGRAGEWRSLRVQVRGAGRTVSARPGYVIAASPDR